MYQELLFNHFLNPIKLKEGKTKCPACGRMMKGYGYNLDVKLVGYAIEILNYCAAYKRDEFRAKDVWEKQNTEFQKLKLFGIIEHCDKANYWELTKKGKDFLTGKIALPRKVWAFDDHVFLEDDELQDISRIEPRWKQFFSDWTMDYVLVPYKQEICLA